MANRKEPYTKVIRVDSSVSATINQTRASTYIGIEADTGRYDLQDVNSSKQLVEKYSTVSKPNASCGTTFLHAGKFLEQFSAKVKRVNKDTVHPGIDSTGNLLYFDKNYNLLDNITRITITTKEKDLDKSLLLLKVTYSDNSVKYFGNSLITPAIKTKYGVTDEVITIDKNNSDDFIRELESNTEYFPPKEVFYVNYGDTINVYGTVRLENILGFSITTSASSMNSVIKLDNNANWGGLDYKVSLTTPTPADDTSKVNLTGSELRYGSVKYIPRGSQSAGTQTYLCIKDSVPERISCYRDGLMSALEKIYETATDLTSYIDEEFVIQHTGDKCIYQDDGDSFNTGVSNSLKSIINDIKYISSGVAGGDWNSLPDVSSGTSIGPIDKLKYIIKGQLKNVEKGFITVCMAENRGSAQEPQLVYTRYLFYFGYSSSTSAIAAYNEECGTEYQASALTPVDIASPNAVNLGPNSFVRMSRSTDDLEEVLCTNPAVDINSDIYYCSNVSLLEIYPPASVESGYSGYLYNTYSTLTKQSQTRYLNSITLQENNMNISREDGTYWIKVGDYVYYNKDLPNTVITGTAVKLASTALTPQEFIALFKVAILDNYATCANLASGDILIGATISTESESCNADDEYGIAQKIFGIEVINGTQTTSAKFALVQKFTSSAKLSHFELELDTSNLKSVVYNLDTTYAFTNHNDPISFDPSAVDGNGVNLYYDKFNYLDRDFHIELLNEDGNINVTADSPFRSGDFGNEVTPRKAKEQDFLDALEDLEDAEYKPDFIFDAGLTSPAYYNKASDFGDNYAHAMVPVAVPAIRVVNGRRYKYTLEDARNFYSKLQNFTNMFIVGPSGWQRETVFGDISFECSPTYYYLQRVLSNTNAVTTEFQPIYWKMQGRIATSDPVIGLTSKADREALLDMNINSIIKSIDGGYSYFNGNYTNQAVNSVFSEEQNVRINNKIAHICDNYIDLNVMAKNHTNPLRKRVQDALSGLIREGVVDNRGEDTLLGFRVVVDETNNSDYGRKITIDVYATYGESINEALVYSRTEQLVGNG